MTAKAILLSLNALVHYPEKAKKRTIKANEIRETLGKFQYVNTKNVGFSEDLLGQISEFIKNNSEVDVSKYCLFKETFQVLAEIKALGFIIVVTSDSTHPTRTKKIVKELGLENVIDWCIDAGSLGCRKSSEKYLEKVFEIIGQKDECWVVATRVDKEIVNAEKLGLPHVWVNNNLENIVKDI